MTAIDLAGRAAGFDDQINGMGGLNERITTNTNAIAALNNDLTSLQDSVANNSPVQDFYQSNDAPLPIAAGETEKELLTFCIKDGQTIEIFASAMVRPVNDGTVAMGVPDTYATALRLKQTNIDDATETIVAVDSQSAEPSGTF